MKRNEVTQEILDARRILAIAADTVISVAGMVRDAHAISDPGLRAALRGALQSFEEGKKQYADAERDAPPTKTLGVRGD